MDVDSGDKTAAIRIWILEYACKHRMRKVADVILRHGPWKCAGCATDGGHCINPIFLVQVMFEDLAHNAKLLLDRGLTAATLRNIEKGALQISMNCLQVLYYQQDEMPFPLFYKYLYALKLLFMIIALVNGEEKEEIAKLIPKIFPYIRPDDHASFLNCMRLTEEQDLAYQSQEQEARSFIHQMLLKQGRQENDYVNDYLVPQAGAFFRTIVDLTPEIIRTAIEPFITDAFIEKVHMGTEDKGHEEEASIELVRELIPPDVREDELLRALKLVDPSVDITSAASSGTSLSSYQRFEDAAISSSFSYIA